MANALHQAPNLTILIFSPTNKMLWLFVFFRLGFYQFKLS